MLANFGICYTRRDVGPCRVRLVSLTDGAIFLLFLTDEEQFANLQIRGSPSGWPTKI